MVIRNSYVDDILQSVDNVEEARRIAQETETMLSITKGYCHQNIVIWFSMSFKISPQKSMCMLIKR
jgi:hypothetical protein